MACPRWAYGVTTVPERRQTHLPHTLASLHLAGFTAPTLFIDGEPDPASYRREFRLHCVTRYPRIRPYGNWILSLQELLIRDPEADRYAIFQDDLIISRNAKHYLDRLPMPGQTTKPHPAYPFPTAPPPRGYWNLYTFPSQQSVCPPNHTGFYESRQHGKGALALVFTRQAVIDLLSSPRVVSRAVITSPSDKARWFQCIDGMVIDNLKKFGYKEYVHSPSLTQHTGTASTIARSHNEQKLAVSFRGEDWDATTLLPPATMPPDPRREVTPSS